MSRPFGYQLRHRDLRACVVTVPLGWREMPHNPAYGVGGRCPTCNVVHRVKTYHLNVDSDGCCTVSPTVFDNLCKAGAVDGVPDDMLVQPNGGRPWRLPEVPFEFVGAVEPPPLKIGMGAQPGSYVMDGEGRMLYQPLMRVVNIHDDFGE